ncbi:MAG: hypothetical protein Unbinned3818contig1000_49 [Prokaryotic dsDNA virus sp.]|nr:hypothetical protein [Phycisphaerae bacterium]QDP45978.1 MAG: hypothetical protein Unbinned3818contig1000_49 [Prokaryotic dsDNA virus sp.]|tara:strand:+ start:24937 stop:25467 length:531 start_codon:yes stop_codon:yes gene_type:complete
MSIESTILAWATDVTGLDVWQSPIDTSKDKPQGEYVTFQIASIVMSDFNGSEVEGKDEDFITRTTTNNAQMLISFNVFGYQAYQKIIEMNASEDFWQHRNTLKTGGISINDFGDPQNLTGLGDTNFVNRWQADVEFNIAFETKADWDRLKSISLAGEFTKIDESGGISSTINWPNV